MQRPIANKTKIENNIKCHIKYGILDTKFISNSRTLTSKLSLAYEVNIYLSGCLNILKLQKKTICVVK